MSLRVHEEFPWKVIFELTCEDEKQMRLGGGRGFLARDAA